MGKITRQSALLLGTAATPLPLLGYEIENEATVEKKLRIVVVGAHPDDPESGCGGTIALYTSLGHEVTILYLTRGEAGIEQKTPQEAAAIRTTESEKACATLKALPIFADQIDGNTEVNGTRYASFRKMLESQHLTITKSIKATRRRSFTQRTTSISPRRRVVSGPRVSLMPANGRERHSIQCTRR